MRTLSLFVAACSLSFAQLDSDTITITTTGQTSALQPDGVGAYLSVAASRELGLDEVLKALEGVAVSEANLTGVSDSGGVCLPTTSGCSPTRAWTFSFTAPLAKLNETLKTLAGIEAARQSGISIYASIGSNGTPPKQECAYPTIISQARRHAENVAAAAGLRVGGIVAMSDGSGMAQPDAFAIPTAIAIFDPATNTGVWTSFSAPPRSPACAAVVQFKLLR